MKTHETVLPLRQTSEHSRMIRVFTPGDISRDEFSEALENLRRIFLGSYGSEDSGVLPAPPPKEGNDD
jgi:hypothetical protein